MRHVRSSTPQGGKFQSAPAIAGGRCRASCARPGTPCQFQSAPAIAGGRCGDTLNPPRTVVLFQSAPAIAGGRCTARRRRGRAPRCFNPRPPLLAGDASLLGHSSNLERVSIRARHCWRAMLQASADHARGAKFQSAPAIAGGRCTAGTPATTRSWRFNPRPPLLAGDACASRAIRRASTVSIRARHCWRAMRCVQRSRPAYWAVSIRARHCWRAMLARSRIRASRRSRTSSPAFGESSMPAPSPTLPVAAVAGRSGLGQRAAT